jgi:hypothetical protein
MMTQTLALLLDGYRELNAKKMFWVVLILTAMVMAGFAVLGVNSRTVTILWYEPMGDLAQFGGPGAPLALYKMLYSNVVVGFWLTWFATILALISTAGIFPDFLTSGAIDLYLAKPISRRRLFLTKYLSGLLFVTLQVTVFAVVSFLVLGIRGGLWQPGLFWSIPLIVLFFSYLFSICVLLGVWTRSTIAALLLTLLAWFGIFGLDFIDRQINTFSQYASMQREYYDAQLGAIDRRVAQLPKRMPGEAPEGEEQAGADPTQDLKALMDRRDEIARRRDNAVLPQGVITTQRVLFGIKSFVPKTRETTSLLDRVLFTDKDLQEASRHDKDDDEELLADAMGVQGDFHMRRGPRRDGSTVQLQADRGRSPVWIIGTSLAFEAVVLLIAGWFFCRRDF